jgi:hypothetical protein
MDLAPERSYVATARGTLYHRPDCASVAGKTGLKSVDPTKTTLEPCKICNP